jgi:MFS-type transporter involved in bile tolerance (Atg22 family)
VAAGIWYGALYGRFIYKFPNWVPTRTATAGVSLCQHSFTTLLADLKDLTKKYPEAAKFLLALVFLQNGLGTTVLTVATSYLLEQLRMASLQVNLLYVIVLISGLAWGQLLRIASKKLSFRKLLLGVTLNWMVLIVIIVLAIYEPIDGNFASGSFILILVLGLLMLAPGLVWWYSLAWPAFMSLIPEEQVNQYAGVYTFVRMVSLIPEPFIYAACSNAFTSASTGRRVGLASVAVWDVIAIPFILWINFEKGKRDCGRGDAAKANV